MSYYSSDPNQQQQNPGGGGFYGGGGYSNTNASAAATPAAAANVQAWQANAQQQQSYNPQQQPGMIPQQQQHQQQQQQQAWNPYAAAAFQTAMGAAMAANSAGGNDVMLNTIGAASQSFFQQGTARMVPGLESTMLTLRSYFAVDNKYVQRKIQRVLFPFFTKNWQRQIKQHASPDMPTQYELPVQDENAPDLYLPCMSLITYVLLAALAYGTAGQFNPEVIPDVCTKCFVTQILEVLAVRFGFYLLQAPVALLDLFSYTGYKYLGLCINLVLALLTSHLFVNMGTMAYYGCFLWTASAAFYFMLKTMANNIPVSTNQYGAAAAGAPNRQVVVLAFASSQLATMWFVSQTKYL